MKGILKQLYSDPKTGLIGPKKLHEKARLIDSTSTLRQVRDWYSEQQTLQQYGDKKNRFDRFKIISYNPNSWQLDLAFVRKKILLTAININSRVGYAKLLPDKKASSVLKVLRR